MNNDVNILIVEDEAIVAFDLERTIRTLGYNVTARVTNHDDAISSIKEDEPTIVFLDINLGKGKKDGIETAKSIKKIKNIPIIYLTAFSDDETMQRAVETNPVSYQLKPFKREEIKSILLLTLYKIKTNAFANTYNERVSLGCNYYYDKEDEALYYKNKYIKISTQEKMLLYLLVSAKGDIVTNKTIEYHIWADDSVSESSVRTLVYRLRCKTDPRIIESVPYFGVKLSFLK